MSAGKILNVNSPMAPRLVQILYWIALVLIALGLLRGIVGGVRTMTRPMPAQATMAAPPSPGAMSSAGTPAPNTSQARMPSRRGPGLGYNRFRYFRRPGFAGRSALSMGGPIMRGMGMPALGGWRILLALIRAVIAVMLVRVFAEIANAILAMGAKAK